MTAAPTEAAMTMTTVIAACDMLEEEPESELVSVGVGVWLIVKYRID